MILNKQLQVLIETSLAQGRDYEDIRNLLLKQGFKDDDVSDLFAQYRGGGGESVSTPAVQVQSVSTQKTENNSANFAQAQNRVTDDVEKFMNVGTNTQTAKDLLLKQESSFKNIADVRVDGDDFNAPRAERVQGQQYINVGLSGMPEIENVLAEEEFKKKEKSAAPLVITLLTLLVLISGFFYWLFVLKDGGAAIIKDKAGIDETALPIATPTPPELPGTRDPFTGELFEVE